MSNMSFEEAGNKVTELSKRPDNKTLLKLYSLFKQGSTGDVQSKRPGLLDVKGRAKWDAWKSLEGMASDEAQGKYVDLVSQLVGQDQ